MILNVTFLLPGGMYALLLLTDVFIPLLGLFFDELLHQCLALLILQNDDLNASALQVLLASKESFVLANDNPLDFVHYTCTGTHITRREAGVHSRTLVR